MTQLAIDLKVGDKINVIDPDFSPYPINGTVLELDVWSFFEQFAKIRVDNSLSLPVPEIWVNLRHATRLQLVSGATSQDGATK